MILVLAVRLLDNRFHGLAGNGQYPNWPPSCFRLYQAIVAGNAVGDSVPANLVSALKWLEKLPPPTVTVPRSKPGQVIRTYVLNNAESRSRAQKFSRPTLLYGEPRVDYAWTFDHNEPGAEIHAQELINAMRRIRAFGWGIDLAIGSGHRMPELPRHNEVSQRFFPLKDREASGTEIRVPCDGSLESLIGCHREYMARATSKDAAYLESGTPLFAPWPYSSVEPRPYAIFKLVDDNGDTVTYSQSKLIHIAGMLKHLAIRSMASKSLLERLYPEHDQSREPFRDGNPPRDLRGREWDEWVGTYVAGHQSDEDKKAAAPHTQFSYIPLQSVGMGHTDPGVRRVMIVAPIGDDSWLEHLAARLDGERLKPLPGTELPPGTRLERIDDKKKDGVRDAYTEPSNVWASTTPVILPGHDDHKPEKTRKLIEKALAQSGIDLPCEFEWSAFSQFRKMLPAHKYRKDPNDSSKKTPINYIRPDHLLDQSAVHLKITFANGLQVPGPITIGAGRHCGFGLMAAIND